MRRGAYGGGHGGGRRRSGGAAATRAWTRKVRGGALAHGHRGDQRGVCVAAARRGAAGPPQSPLISARIHVQGLVQRIRLDIHRTKRRIVGHQLDEIKLGSIFLDIPPGPWDPASRAPVEAPPDGRNDRRSSLQPQLPPAVRPARPLPEPRAPCLAWSGP